MTCTMQYQNTSSYSLLFLATVLVLGTFFFNELYMAPLVATGDEPFARDTGCVVTGLGIEDNVRGGGRLGRTSGAGFCFTDAFISPTT